MSDSNFSALLRNLSSDYYHNRIGFEEYRAQRKVILDNIDEEFNGRNSIKAQTDNTGTLSIVMRIIEFLKKN